ncbi:NAD-dependent epimerase/dehydratase family protein [Candidatus Parcubacteria bacterium]|nr:MAG: NAD-dependent epimerase/dehydratase family protein [Candidatus Parcubacteria bacterium]
MKYRIIVTGGAGFIGSHVADRYIAAGHHVAVIDNLTTGFRKHVPKKAKFYKADIRNLKRLETIFKKERPHVVNHHAAIAEVIKSVRDPIPTFATNVLGTANVFLALGHYGSQRRRKFIFSSTGGAIYGDPKKIPVDEQTEPVPLSPYGLSKLLGEHIIKFYSARFQIPYLIFRYPNVYGPRQNPKGEAGVVAIVGGQMKHRKKVYIFGDGTKTRDYVFVEDIARANLTALSRGRNVILNLGSGKETSDQQIINLIAEATHYPYTPIYTPFREGEVYRIALNAKKAQQILHWKPRVPLKEGIQKTLATIP